ncbi:hypothetical protein [Thaumasiovibrio sp. DFM-14]|uniref:hypothetical protein n=1 Tax=Thaumasiovibrio sp. DFM-14 TaxID=3384792 RepID=UPI00399FDF3C
MIYQDQAQQANTIKIFNILERLFAWHGVPSKQVELNMLARLNDKYPTSKTPAALRQRRQAYTRVTRGLSVVSGKRPQLAALTRRLKWTKVRSARDHATLSAA